VDSQSLPPHVPACLSTLLQVHRVLVRRSLPRNANSKVLRGMLRGELLSTQSKL
jgi:hypothetical protein